jgi:penicillin-binding protein 1C
MRVILAATLVVVVAVWVLATWAIPRHVPTFEGVRSRFETSEAVLLDRHGAVIQERRVDLRGRRLGWIALADVSPALVHAVIEAEDRRFWNHCGVDVRAVAAALWDAGRGRRMRGASTLAMQLAALLDPALRAGREGRGLLQKVHQMGAALALERRWSKNEIVEAYLNLVTFRGELQGVEAASRGLFDREPNGLGDAEAALLAGLLPAPNAPAEAVIARACQVALRSRSTLHCSEVTAIGEAALHRVPSVRPEVALAPHVAARLLSGSGRTVQGHRIAATLDGGTQRLVLRILQEQVQALRGRNVRDAAALVVDTASGEVLAYVGGIGELSTAPLVDGVRAPRQAGSTLKPFLYGRALESRLVTASTRIDDAPLDIVTPLGSYRPENYDHAFRGPVPVREALASSLNVPAVRVLQQVRVDALMATLRQLGFRGLREPEFYGDSLALGSADVSLWELVGAYRALANGGSYGPLRLMPADPVEAPQRVFSPGVAFIVNDILSDRAGRALSFGLESVLATRFWSAVKTGTSKDMRDNWCVGSSRRFTVGVWVGNFSGAPMWDVSGVDGAAPAWVRIMNALHADTPSDPPSPPQDLIHLGGEWYLAGTEPVASATIRPARGESGLGRILSPTDGTILAVDPDIPSPRQRVLVQAAPADPKLQLFLDGRRLGSAAMPLLWTPLRGRHELALRDAEGQDLETVRFLVR